MLICAGIELISGNDMASQYTQEKASCAMDPPAYTWKPRPGCEQYIVNGFLVKSDEHATRNGPTGIYCCNEEERYDLS